MGAIALAGCGKGGGGGEAVAEYPHKPVKVVVPFAAGGGSDQFVRILQKAMREDGLLAHPIVVINVPGAGGSTGSRRVMEARPDGYTMLNLHEGIITAKYSGITTYGPEAFTPIAATGEAGMVVCVAQDSPYEDLAALAAAAAKEPDTVTFGANVGAPSFIAGRRIEAAVPGCAFRYVQTGGGAKRFAALKGGHIGASAFSIAEYFQFRGAGLRALAYLGEERHGEAREIATAREQGIDVASSNMQFWWAPRGTPADRVERFGDALAAAMETEYVREKLAELRVDPVVLRGEALRAELGEREAAVAAVGTANLEGLPNVPVAVIFLCAALAAGVVVEGRRGGGGRHLARDKEKEEVDWRRWVAVVAASMVYVGVMRLGWIGFPIATTFFVPALGMLWRGGGWKVAPGLLAAGAVLGWGCFFLFTKVFVIDLP